MRLGAVASRHVVETMAVALAVLGLLELSVGPFWSGPVPTASVATIAVACLGSLPLLLRRRFAFAAPALVFTALAAISLAERSGVERGPSFTLFGLLLAFWVAGEQRRGRDATAGAAVGLAALALLAQPDLIVEMGSARLDLPTYCALGAGLTLAAFRLRRRSARAIEVERRAGRLEQEQDERARAALEKERSRIARELHDVIAHCVSVMIVQTGAARLFLDEHPERARAPLLSVEETGRQALAEMRRLLGVLRQDEGEASLTPQPGLANVSGLLEQVREAGLPVELTIEGQAEGVPAGIDLAAYRIVQEALTNALKHGGPCRAQVGLRYGREFLELEVTNDGRRASNGRPGHGLVGMQERVAIYGGELETGSHEGGYTVRARLPLADRL